MRTFHRPLSRRTFLAASGAAAAGIGTAAVARSGRRDRGVSSSRPTRAWATRRRLVPGHGGMVLQRHGARPGDQDSSERAFARHNRGSARRGDHRPLARPPRAERHGRRAASDAATDRAAARTSSTSSTSPTPEPIWYHPHQRSFEQVGRGLYGRADRRGGGPDPGRSRHHLGARRLAPARRTPRSATTSATCMDRATTAGSATPSRSTARCSRPSPCAPASGSGCA